MWKLLSQNSLVKNVLIMSHSNSVVIKTCRDQLWQKVILQGHELWGSKLYGSLKVLTAIWLPKNITKWSFYPHNHAFLQATKNADGILNIFYFQFLGTLGVGCSSVSSYNDLLQRFKNGSRVCCFEGLFLGFSGLFITWLDETSRAFSCPSSICVANRSQSNNSQRHAADNHNYITPRDFLSWWVDIENENTCPRFSSLLWTTSLYKRVSKFSVMHQEQTNKK